MTNGSCFKKGDKVLVKNLNIDMAIKTEDGYERFHPLIVGVVVDTLKLAPQAIVKVGPYCSGFFDTYVDYCPYDYPIGTRLHPKTHKILEM